MSSVCVVCRANFVLRFCNQPLWYFVLRNCCSVDFFYFDILLCGFCLQACISAMCAFTCDFYLYCVITQRGLSLESCICVQVQVCHDKFIHFSFFSVGVLSNHSDGFFLNAIAEHSHPIYLISMSHWHEHFFFCDLPLITHCCPVTVWLKAVHCWLAIFLTD